VLVASDEPCDCDGAAAVAVNVMVESLDAARTSLSSCSLTAHRFPLRIFRFTLRDVLLWTAFVGFGAVFPLGVLLALLVVTVFLTARRVTHFVSPRKPIAGEWSALQPVPYAMLLLLALAWPISHRYLIRHHIQHIATIEFVHDWIGITLGTYWTAESGWSTVPANWASNLRDPLIRFPTATNADGTLIQMTLPYLYVTILTTTCVVMGLIQKHLEPKKLEN